MGRFIVVVLFLMPLSCLAHLSGGPHSMMDGICHPLTGFDHLLALFAVGWMSRRNDGSIGLRFPFVFLVSMAVGAVFGLTGFVPEMVEYGIAISLMILGVLVGFAARFRYVEVPLALTGIFHGFAHGSEFPASVAASTNMAGMILGSMVILFMGARLHGLLGRSQSVSVIRNAISFGIVLAGVFMLMGFA